MKPRHFQRPSRIVPGSTEDILAFLDAHGTQDKDSAAVQDKGAFPKSPIEKGKRGVRRLWLDLHGQTSVDAAHRIRYAIDNCRNHGIKELLIIHGHGLHSAPAEGPVLKKLLYEMLENELAIQVHSFRSGKSREGGEGATVVYLK